TPESPQIRKYRKGELVKEKTGKGNSVRKKNKKTKGSAADPAGLSPDSTGIHPEKPVKKKSSVRTPRPEKDAKPEKAKNTKDSEQGKDSGSGNAPDNRNRNGAAKDEKDRQSPPARERNGADKKKRPE